MEADSELLGRIVRRDKDAFSLLYDRWAPVLFNFCVRILRDVEDAEEVLQDVFVQVWKDAHRFDLARGSAKTWLFTIARSRSLDRWRSRKSVDKRVDAEVPPAEGTHASGSAAERAIRGSWRVRWDACRQGESGSLLAYRGLTQEEIASRLDEPLRTIRAGSSGLARLHSSAEQVDG
jgi:RNA polymerase sigma-70 factor (ECF subfamily)